MTMPSYIINWEDAKIDFSAEETRRLVGSLRDLSSNHKIEGFVTHIPFIGGRYSVLEWTAKTNTAIMDLSYVQSCYHPFDYWELWVDGDRIMETVYVKEMGNLKHWETVHYVYAGQTIRLIHHNNSGTSKEIWVDLGYADNLKIEEKG